MSALLVLIPFFLSAAASAAVSDASSSAMPLRDISAYDALQSYNLPIGLLPKGALGYDLDTCTGNFSVSFNGTCSFSLEGSYQLRYQPSISGRITTNRLSDLRGVSVKVLLFWINIIEVVRNGDGLEFSVGIASADFSIDNFYVCPQCGCGLNCGAIRDQAKEGIRMKLRSTI